ncbi:MAG: DUF3322 domain-containing protein [Spirochaetia bacterium]|jgi:hypothetical protein
MIGPDKIRHVAKKRYKDYLRCLVEGTDIFPVEIRFSKVKPGEAAERFASLREEIAALRAGSAEGGKNSYHVEWSARSDRLAGSQSFPSQIYFPDAACLLGLIDKEEEVGRFKADLELLRHSFPELMPWAARHPDRIVSCAGEWERIVSVLRWFVEHPRPSVFLREIPAVEDTKFVERNKALLRDLLDIALPVGAADPSASGFEERFGLRRIEQSVRLRLLDLAISNKRLSGVQDLSVPVSELAKLAFPELETLIVVENKASFSGLELFLTLPALKRAAAIFGSGFAAQSLRGCRWMADRRLFYWGDIDTHGFRILAGLREAFPRIKSVLMDEGTFDRFPEYRSDAPIDLVEPPRGLQEAEHSLFLRLARLYSRNRLEQERLPTSWTEGQFRVSLGA